MGVEFPKKGPLSPEQRPLRVGITIPRLPEQPLGMHVYIESFLRAVLRTAPRKWGFSISTTGIKGRKAHIERSKLVDPAARAQWSLMPLPASFQSALIGITGRCLGDQRLKNSDVVHWLGAGHVPTRLERVVMTLQDVIPLCVEGMDRTQMDKGRAALIKLARQASRIITISEFSKSEIAKTLAIDPDKMIVIPNGVDLTRFHPLAAAAEVSARARLAELGVHSPYLLHLGGAAPRKNAARVVESFNILKSRHRIAHSLVFAGSRIMLQDVRERIASSPYADEIISLPYLADEDALLLLQLADLLVFASTYEGFGLPPLEAMACGVPVALSSAASLPEVGGSAVVYFNPTDVEEMAGAVHRLIADSALRQRCIGQGLSRCKQFTWDLNAERTLEVYEQLQAG